MSPVEPARSSTPSLPGIGPGLLTVVATTAPLQITSNYQTRFSTFSLRERIQNTEPIKTQSPSATPELPEKNWCTTKKLNKWNSNLREPSASTVDRISSLKVRRDASRFKSRREGKISSGKENFRFVRSVCFPDKILNNMITYS